MLLDKLNISWMSVLHIFDTRTKIKEEIRRGN
jgi:hypothetical protein